MTAWSTIFGACVCVCSAAVAAETPQQFCDDLEQALAEEVDVLAGVIDAASASTALPHLHACLGMLKAICSGDEGVLWNYINNTAGAKTRLVEVLERLAIEFRRLEQAEFYGCAGLREALAPQLQLHASGK